VCQKTSRASFCDTAVVVGSELRSVTCRMGSDHTRHPSEMNALRLNPNQAGRYSIYLSRRDKGWVDLVGWLPVTHSSNSKARLWGTALI